MSEVRFSGRLLKSFFDLMTFFVEVKEKCLGEKGVLSLKSTEMEVKPPEAQRENTQLR